MFKSLYFVILCSFSFGSSQLKAQDNHAIKDDKIIEILNAHQSDSMVGIQISILHKEYQFMKSFGMANIAFDIPMNNHTTILSTDIANQFVAYAILLLEAEGKLKLADKASNFLTDLPEYMQHVTIAQLLSHTHKLPDWMGYQWLASWRYDDFRSKAQMYSQLQRLSKLRQTDSVYEYNSTGFVIAADIIEKITNMSFQAFAQNEIFSVLDMNDSYFQARINQIHKNQAEEYFYSGEFIFSNDFPYHSFDSNRMFSSIYDLNLWSRHLQGKSKIHENIVKKLIEYNIDIPNEDYNIGLGTFHDDLGGITRVHHNGLAYGNKVYICHFFEQDLSIVIQSNSSAYNASNPAIEIAEFLLQDQMIIMADDPQQVDRIPTAMDHLNLDRYIGDYWDQENLQARTITLENDTLIYEINSGRRFKLLALAKHKFMAMNTSNDLVFDFNFDSTETKLNINVNNDYSYSYESFQKKEPSNQNTEEIKGLYYSKVLDVFFRIETDKEGLYTQNNRSNKIYLKPLMEDSYISDLWYFGLLKFQRSADGKLGFSVQSGSVDSCYFEKVI